MSEKKNILIVEDEKTAADALVRKFTKEGFHCTAVADGVSAVEYAQKNSYDVILLDLVLPRKDGYEVLHDLQEAGSTVPVIVLTNLCAESDAARAKELGAAAHFVKSMTPMKSVVEHITKIISKDDE